MNHLYESIGKYYAINGEKIAVLNHGEIPFQYDNYLHIPQTIREEIEQYNAIKQDTKIVPTYLSYFITPNTKKNVYVAIWGGNKKEYSKYVKRICKLFHFFDHIISSTNECSKELFIYLFLTNHKKQLPRQNNQELDEIHVNSAFSYSCEMTNAKNVIYIFRKEEWFKVLIHECMHALGMDFSWLSVNELQHVDHQVKQLFHIETSHVKLYEAYTEFWAEIINICIYVFEKTNQPRKTKQVEMWLQTCVQYETIWSCIQVNKVLKHYQLSYMDLIDNSTRKVLYKESKTAVFSYYILKCVLMVYHKEFISWCCKHLTPPSNKGTCFIFSQEKTKHEISTFLTQFYQFLEKYATCRDFYKNLSMIDHEQLKDKSLTMSYWGKYTT